MTQQNECSEILELIPEYAFGLTDEAASRRIEAALPTCPEAARQLDEYQRLQAEMRDTVPQIEPPPALAQRLSDALRSGDSASMALRPEAARPQPAGSETIRPEARAVRPDLSRRRNEPTKTRARADARLFFGLVAAAAIIALIGTNIYWLNRVDSTTREREVLIELVRQYRTEWFMVNDASTLQMTSTSAPDSPMSMMVFWNQDLPTGLVALSDFPALAVGREYQLWLLRGESAPVSGGTFVVDASGFGVMTFSAPEVINSFDAVGITEEPAGGSAAPTTTPLVVGTL